jgi:hypothetical protein
MVPYKEMRRERVKLPDRQKRGKYKDPEHPFKYIEEVY